MGLRCPCAALAVLLFVCILTISAAHDDEEQEFPVGTTAPPNHKTISIEGQMANEHFIRLARTMPIRVLINDGEYAALVRSDGSFQVHDVPEGVHFLQYFVEREKFDPTAYLKNPMILLVGGSMLLMFVMPKMVDNMSEEDKKQFREATKSSSAAALKGGGAQ